MHDIIIIGAGIAGMTAAIYARRAGLGALIIEKNIYGGQMVQTADIDNYPGVPSVGGAELSMTVYQQAEALGAEFVFDTVTALEQSRESWKVTCAGGEYNAKAVIFANGATHRRLGCKGEDEFAARGVSYCATCDGSFFRGKDVAVVGGGNTALEDALFLANMCSKVYLIHRRSQYRADRVLADAAGERDNIIPVLDSQVEEILGEGTVTAVRTVSNDGQGRTLEVSGVFIAVGVQPDTDLLRGIAPRDESGYILADENGETGIDGLYAAGDCRSKRLRQIVTAAADGANAAFSAANYINRKG